jgi:hypothetical protein
MHVDPTQLAVIDIDSDPEWYAKLKANRALAQKDERVLAVQEWAKLNYEQGADVIVEAFEPDEILKEIVEDATTVEMAVANARDYCGLRREVENDVRASGDLPPLPGGDFS